VSNEPIFIVGIPRSGTTLLAAMLAAHSRLSCGPETHFFRWLSRTDVRRLCESQTWPEPAADFIRSIRHKAFLPGTARTLLEKYEIPEGSIPAYLQTKAPSVPSMLCSVTEQYMKAKGKARWVEKTPDHLRYLSSIREYFTDSPIIRIVRDPRDVALSLMRVPWGARSLLEGLLHWQRLDSMSREFVGTDRLAYTVRFEDLVSSPREELRKLCRFVNETFEEGMLDTSSSGTAINSRNVPWKSKVSQGADVTRVAVWRSELTRRENQLAEAVLGDRLAALGYPTDEEFSRVGEVYPRSGVAEEYAEALAILASKGVRLWKARPDEKSRAKIYLGEPSTAEWLGEQRTGRAIRVLPVLADIARATIRFNDLYWIPNREDGKWTGCASFVLRQFLSPYKVVLNPCDPTVS